MPSVNFASGGCPTDTELMILQMFWQYGPGTAREIHDDFVELGRPRALTTIHRFLEIMVDKGLIERESPRRPYRYRALWEQDRIESRLVSDLLHRAFDGDPVALAKAFLAIPLTDDQLNGIHQALDNCLHRRAETPDLPRQDNGPRHV